MIDIDKAKEEFIIYTNKFDIENFHIKGKIEHSMRVMEVSRKLATMLNLNEEETNLAMLIGLLHDIGRFEQFTKYGSFRDAETVDHGDLGVKILDENNFLRKFIQDNRYDNIIIKAIFNHNKYAIEEDLTDKELLFAKLIRDADKIDILFEVETIFYEDRIEEISNSKIDKEMEEQITLKKQIVKRKGYHPQGVNAILIPISFVYDINYKESLRLIKENNYINNIFDKFTFTDNETKIKIEEIRKQANDFINEKIK